MTKKDTKAQAIIDQANDAMTKQSQTVIITSAISDDEHPDGVYVFPNFRGFQLGAQWVMVTTEEGRTHVFNHEYIVKIEQFYNNAE